MASTAAVLQTFRLLLLLLIAAFILGCCNCSDQTETSTRGKSHPSTNSLGNKGTSTSNTNLMFDTRMIIIIASSAAAGLVIVVILIVCVCWWCRRRRQRRADCAMDSGLGSSMDEEQQTPRRKSTKRSKKREVPGRKRDQVSGRKGDQMPKDLQSRLSSSDVAPLSKSPAAEAVPTFMPSGFQSKIVTTTMNVPKSLKSRQTEPYNLSNMKSSTKGGSDYVF